MRISEFIRTTTVAALLAASAGGALALDPEKQTPPAAGPATPLSIMDAFRAGTQAYLAGNKQKAVTDLQYAADQGHLGAQWKLGRMYAEGDGVTADHYRAFVFFSEVAAKNAETSPFLPASRFVANAFVALGGYHLAGIPKTEVKRDPRRAFQMFRYAATYFGDADAQFHLGKMQLEGLGVPKDPRAAARWLHAAATKGQYQAQALLGQLLLEGNGVPRQAARGLMWLTLARDAAAAQGDEWIVQAYEEAIRSTSDDDRIVARTYLEEYLRGR